LDISARLAGGWDTPRLWRLVLIRVTDQVLHFLMEAALGLCGVLAMVACIGAWRLGQGPIDITRLVLREQGLVTPPGTTLSIGSAALAWEGFLARDQPLDIRVRDLTLASTDGRQAVQVRQARLTLSIGNLLIGRIVPRTLAVDGASVQLRRDKDGSLAVSAVHQADTRRGRARATENILTELAKPVRLGDGLPWLSQLRRAELHNAQASLHDDAFGVVWRAPHVDLAFDRLAGGGVSGHAQIDLAVGAVQTTVSARAELRTDGTHVTASTTPVSPATLAAAVAAFSPLAGAALPVKADLDATIGPSLDLRVARIGITAGAGTLRAGGSDTGLQSADAVVVVEPSELILQSARVAFAAQPGKQAPPVLTAQATATLLAGRVHATFAIAIPGLDMADLGDYWPPQIARGSRVWLVQNIVAGHAHNAHVEGALDTPSDLSDLRLSALSGEILADDVSLFWLRPIPPLTHGRAHLTVEGPDSLHITMDSAEQGPLRLQPGSTMEITGLAEKHQLGDIDVRIGGPFDAALGLLNHPRLRLLARSGLDFTGASGQAQARLQVHLPLEDTVTMDDIRIRSTATLTSVHLGRVAASRDLDAGQLALKVDNDGLALTGHGAYAGIPTDLTLDMDFRDGPPAQVLQHVTAHGTASAAEIAAAGLPESVGRAFPDGSAAIDVDYAALRNRMATLLLDADLQDAEIQTPFGWAKPAGAHARAGARLVWDKGQLVSFDHLHAEGPGLVIASHARLEGEHAHALVFDTLEFGQTRAQGEIGFPDKQGDPLSIALSGPMLDLSAYFKETQSGHADSQTSERETAADAPPARGEPWSVRLNFARATLAKGKILSPFRLDAANDGLHVTRAALDAGAPGELQARIVPHRTVRSVSVTSSDAGVFLRAMGVADNLDGGRLQLDGVFADMRPGDPLTGTATLENFTMRQAPAIGRLLQGMTLYGLSDVLRGPGLHFSRLVAPFRWQRRVLSLYSARAFSPSLGLTAQGDIDLVHRVADVKGTVVPAYFFNQLLGDLPLVGRVFSPEKGGGVFAARYSVTGKLADPKVGVNPLSALTPGFLREVFGLLSGKPKVAVTPPVAAAPAQHGQFPPAQR
jgi:hypothetical protein